MRGFPKKNLYLNERPSLEPIKLVVTETPFKRENVEIRFTESIWDEEPPKHGAIFYLDFKASDQ